MNKIIDYYLYLIGKESHVTERVKCRVSWEKNIESHLFGNLDMFHSKYMKKANITYDVDKLNLKIM